MNFALQAFLNWLDTLSLDELRNEKIGVARVAFLAGYEAAEQKFALDGAVCNCKSMSSIIGEHHAEECPLHYPPRQ
jgi:hypothetical protein